MRTGRSTSILGLLLGFSIAAGGAETPARDTATETLKDPGAMEFSGDPAKPRHHFRTPNPADLSAEQALNIYRELRDDMGAIYALSGHAAAKSFYRWRKYNTAPYRSATHGHRYVSNYANGVARSYGRLGEGERMPVGSVIAKDSFTVTERGGIHPGSLFIMEKMPEGFSYVSGDWRYTMILPDGSIFGVTGGENGDKVEYCIGCHLARERHDHLFFVPEPYRTETPDAASRPVFSTNAPEGVR